MGLESGNDDADAVDAVIDDFPAADGERGNLRFACTDESVSTLPDVLSYLRENNYAVCGYCCD